MRSSLVGQTLVAYVVLTSSVTSPVTILSYDRLTTVVALHLSTRQVMTWSRVSLPKNVTLRASGTSPTQLELATLVTPVVHFFADENRAFVAVALRVVIFVAFNGMAIVARDLKNVARCLLTLDRVVSKSF
jgi:hypothetical protein